MAEQEIIKHAEKAVEAIRNKNFSFWHKLKDALYEIAIIVFAVTISIWFNNWSDHRKQQREVKEFLIDLKADLSIDTANMISERNDLMNEIKTFKSFNIDSMRYDYINRETHQSEYESFKSSGKLINIENKDLKKSIVTYYNEEMPPLYSIEKMLNQKVTDIIELPDNVNKKLLKNKITFCIQIQNSLIGIYNDNINSAQSIIKQIDKLYPNGK